MDLKSAPLNDLSVRSSPDTGDFVEGGVDAGLSTEAMNRASLGPLLFACTDDDA